MNYSLKLSDKKRPVLFGKVVGGLIVCNTRYEALKFIDNADLLTKEHQNFAKMNLMSSGSFTVLGDDQKPLLSCFEQYVHYSEEFEDFNARFFK